jgi:uncharacterized protein
VDENQKAFLLAPTFAVAGASRDRDKYGNRVFRALLDSGRVTMPVNPHADEVEQVPAVGRLSDLPVVPDSLSIVTPPRETRRIVNEAVQLGVRNIWVQPGAEDSVASQLARNAGVNMIDDGSCVLVALAFNRSS